MSRVRSFVERRSVQVAGVVILCAAFFGAVIGASGFAVNVVNARRVAVVQPLTRDAYMAKQLATQHELGEFLKVWADTVTSFDRQQLPKFADGLRYFAVQVDAPLAGSDATTERGLAIFTSSILRGAADEFEFAAKTNCEQCHSYGMFMVGRAYGAMQELTESK